MEMSVNFSLKKLQQNDGVEKLTKSMACLEM